MGCPELLFNPEINGINSPGLARATWTAINESDQDVRRDLCSNMVLSGGSSMFNNIDARLHEELINYAEGAVKFNITAGPDRRYYVWKGASTLVALSSFSSSWITLAEY